MAECDNPVTDTGRKNSVPFSDPAQACPVGIPDNTATVSWVDGLPVFSLGAGVGSAEGGGDTCPAVPPPAIEFVTDAENIGTGEGIFAQLSAGVLQFLSLNFGSGFAVTNEGTSLLIELIDSGVISWNDVLSKPTEFPPSAHTHTLANITDAGSAAGADSADFATAIHTHTLAQITDAGTAAASATGDFATAAQGATADSAVQPTDSATTLNMNTARLLGRSTAAVGAVEEITVGIGLSLAAGSLTATGGVTPAAHAASHTDGTDDIQDATAAQKGLATATQITKLDGIEALADVTDATNVNAAGAVMESDFDANTILAATADNTPTIRTIDENDIVGRLAGGAIAGITLADVTEESAPAVGDFFFGWESGGAIRKYDMGKVIGIVPPNEQSAAYPLVLTDAGKSIDHPASDANARTFTIPANGSVAYPVGTTISFSNMTAEVVTIAITTDTMYLAGAGTTGSRSLAQYGVATARKITSTAWLIVGTGLT